jgi:tetratricopeptide (TPR) repeat protein
MHCVCVCARALFLLLVYVCIVCVQGYKSMLEFDETHIRALIRRGQCFAYIGEYEEAQTDFRRALEVDAANQDALAWLESVGKLIKKQEKKELAMAVKMFAS